MATQIQTSIQIDASPEEVWAVFSDFDAYPDWNPFVKAVLGDVAVGKQIEAHVGNMVFKPKVLVWEENRAFTWRGVLMAAFLFQGDHAFELVPNTDGTTTFKHGETFTGLLVPFFKKQLLSGTKKGFEAMNHKLKERVEGVKKE